MELEGRTPGKQGISLEALAKKAGGRVTTSPWILHVPPYSKKQNLTYNCMHFILFFSTFGVLSQGVRWGGLEGRGGRVKKNYRLTIHLTDKQKDKSVCFLSGRLFVS